MFKITANYGDDWDELVCYTSWRSRTHIADHLAKYTELEQEEATLVAYGLCLANAYDFNGVTFRITDEPIE